MQTILLKIMPPEYVKDMREQLAQGKHEDDYFSFEQALFDEINTRKMDEESRKKGGRINVLNSSGDDDKVKRNADGIEYEEVEIWSEEWQCDICGVAQKRSRSRSRSRGEDDEQDRPTKAPRDQEATKGDKGKGRGKRPGGPCWMCGGPHFQRECPNLGKGGPPYPITTAWTSWRLGSFPGPTPAQWNSWLPKPYKGKGKGKSKGKGKGGKGDKGKGKGQLSGLGEYPTWGPPLGHMPYWDENGYPSELVPLCATVRNVSNEDEQGWKTVKGRKETNAPIETQIRMKEVNSGGGTRFDALEVTMNSEEDFPVLMADVQNGAAKQTRTIMKKMPKKGSQAKAKQENRTHGEVARVGRTVPTFAKIGPSGMRETLSRGGGNCHPLLGVVADDNDDKLLTERAKEIREICMKERAGNCEHRKQYHDRPLCALPQQTGSQWQGWMLGWQYLALTVDSGAADTVIPHMLVQDHAIQETDASRNGLNYASATGDPIPNLGEQKLPLLTQEGSLRAMTFQAAPVDRALGSVKRMCSSGHMVVFDDDGSHVLNKMTGEVNWMREESGNYIMDLWVMPNKGQGLTRQRLR